MTDREIEDAIVGVDVPLLAQKLSVDLNKKAQEPKKRRRS